MSFNTNPFQSEVKNYGDDKIIDIVRTPKKFSPKLVEACRAEVKLRAIEDKIDVETSSNQFASTAKNHSTEKLKFISDYPDEYNIQLVKAARAELVDRGENLEKEVKEHVNRSSNDEVMEIQKKLKAGQSTDQLIDYLMDKGISEEKDITRFEYKSRILPFPPTFAEFCPYSLALNHILHFI